MKTSLTVFAEVVSRYKLPFPRYYNGQEINYQDLKHQAEVEFPSWPVDKMHLKPALNSLRAKIAEILVDHKHRAHDNANSSVIIQPVIFIKKNKVEYQQVTNQKYGFKFNKPIEFDQRGLQPYFVNFKIGKFCNEMDLELLIHQSVDKILPSVEQELISAGITT